MCIRDRYTYYDRLPHYETPKTVSLVVPEAPQASQYFESPVMSQYPLAAPKIEYHQYAQQPQKATPPQRVQAPAKTMPQGRNPMAGH